MLAVSTYRGHGKIRLAILRLLVDLHVLLRRLKLNIVYHRVGSGILDPLDGAILVTRQPSYAQC